MTIRVCRVINAMWTGGVQVRLCELLPRLREHGAQPHVCTLRARGELANVLEQQTGIPTTHVEVRGRLHPRYLIRLARFFRRHRFDVVHTHMYQSNISGVAAARLAGVPCIISQNHNVGVYHGKARHGLTDRLMMPFRDRYLAVSRAVAEDTARALGLPADRFEVLTNGIAPHPKPDLKPPERLKAELCLPLDALVIIHVARLHPNKNHRAFIEQLPDLFQREPRLHLLLVGKGREQPALEHLVHRLGLETRVHFLGHRRDVPDLMSMADISILPSRVEGFSNVVLESMVYGAALVVTDVGGAREQIRHGVDGFIVPPGDMRTMATAVLRLVHQPELRQRLAAEAARRVHAFSLDAMAERTMSLYESILRQRKRT